MGSVLPEFFSGNIKQFWVRLYALVNKPLLEAMEEPGYRAYMGNALFERVAGRKETNAQARKHNPVDMFIFQKVFKPFSEIFNSYASLQNIRMYMSIFPFRKQPISRVAYLRYHIENYLNEIYILQTRLKAFITTIGRAYKDSPEYPKIHKAETVVFTAIDGTFEQYVKVRGSHVHRYRYEDDDVERLTTLDLLMRGKDQDFTKRIGVVFKMAYQTTRKKWQLRLSKDIAAIHAVLDAYFLAIFGILWAHDEILLPIALRKVVRQKESTTNLEKPT